MARKPGPPKEFPEQVLATFPEGLKARLKAVLDDGENERQFIREAVIGRVEKRERKRRRAPNEE